MDEKDNRQRYPRFFVFRSDINKPERSYYYWKLNSPTDNFVTTFFKTMDSSRCSGFPLIVVERRCRLITGDWIEIPQEEAVLMK